MAKAVVASEQARQELDILMSGPDAANELFELMTRLQAAAKPGESAEIAKPLDVLEAAAEALKSSFSGSWLGYHAYVYSPKPG